MRPTVLFLTALACTNASLSARESPTAISLRAVLAVLPDSSAFASNLRVDPRVLANAEAFDPGELTTLPESTVRAHQKIIRDAGYAEGDFFLAVQCDPAGRMTVTKGMDTLVAPVMPPIPPDLQATCDLAGDAPVLILTLPERVGGMWRLRAHIVGPTVGELWRFTIAMNGTVHDAERLSSWRV